MSKLTILAAPINAVGHVNACAGALSGLLARGHRIIFVLEKAFEGSLAPFGFEEYIFSNVPLESQTANPGALLAQIFVECKIIGHFSPLEKIKNVFKFFDFPKNREDYKRLNSATQNAIELFAPDLIYFDGIPLLPAIYYSGIPWVKNVSTSPLFYDNDAELPPGASGLPSNDKSSWHLFDEARANFQCSPTFNSVITEMGYLGYPNDIPVPETQMLTVHAYPEELNYEPVRRRGWFNLEVFNIDRNPISVELNESIPDSFLNDTLNGKFSGNLVYVSMGSMGSIDLNFIKRLVLILARTSHKYILSKGPRSEEYELGPNMFGDRYLPQTAIMPHVDLVITHGGNNTVTETFAEGKPMIVFPLFADQFDNAQRLHETGFGARIDPYNFTESELIGAIDQLLNDGHLKQKLQSVSQRLKELNKHEELAIKIEQLMEFQMNGILKVALQDRSK